MLGPATSRYLVITRAGPNSLHRHWLAPAGERRFDLLVASFAPLRDCPVEPGLFHIYVPGKKVQGWKATLQQNLDFIEQYDYVALIDDDIDTDAASISAIFDIGRDEGFSIFQPGLTWNSHFTYAGHMRNPLFRFRRVNYIEMMAPFFTRDALRCVAPLFEYGWESGFDLVWGSALPAEQRQFAIIDAIPVHHTRPVGIQKEANGFINRNYESDIMASLNHFAMKWPSLVAFSGQTRRGREVGRIGVAWRTLVLLSLPFNSPTPRAWRRVCDHIRHQWMRRPAYSEHVRAMLSDDAARRLPQPEPVEHRTPDEVPDRAFTPPDAARGPYEI